MLSDTSKREPRSYGLYIEADEQRDSIIGIMTLSLKVVVVCDKKVKWPVSLDSITNVVETVPFRATAKQGAHKPSWSPKRVREERSYNKRISHSIETAQNIMPEAWISV